MDATTTTFHVTAAQAAAQLPEGTPLRFATMLHHGSMLLEWYAPQGHDPQQPHAQDEVYVIVSGTGTFMNNGERHPFGPGDVLFVPAGVEHRFEAFSADFQTWVIFYGPQGGEEKGRSEKEEGRRIEDGG